MMLLGSFFYFITIIFIIYFIALVLIETECAKSYFRRPIFGNTSSEEMAMAGAVVNKLFACDFEVFGKVQGVFFRKFTEKEAKQLGLHGWCMNTPEGTVKGQIEGSQSEINEMKNWLRSKGSPKSRIAKAVFSDVKEIPVYTFKSFVIKR